MSPTQGQGHRRERWGALLWALSPQSRVFISFEADGERELGLAWDYDIVLCLCTITWAPSLSSGGPNVGEGSECLGLTFCVSRQGTHWLSAWTESFLHLIFLVSYLLSEKTVLFPFLAKENKPDLTVFFSHSFSGPFITQYVQWVVFFLVTAHPLPHECAPHWRMSDSSK